LGDLIQFISGWFVEIGWPKGQAKPVSIKAWKYMQVNVENLLHGGFAIR
jgi:hypothetical protein